MSNINEHVEDLISFYLDGELDEKERRTFELHIASCSECKNLYESHLRIHKDILDKGRLARRHLSTEELFGYSQKKIIASNQLSRIEKHLSTCDTCQQLLQSIEALDVIDPGKIGADENKYEPSVNLLGQWFDNITMALSEKRIVVGMALAAIFIIMIWVFPTQNPYEDLVEINPPEYVSTDVRGRYEEPHETFLKGMELYQDKRYEAAIPFMSEAAEQDEENPQYQFYCGLTLLLSEEVNAGLKYLEKEIVMHSVFQEEAMWFVAMGKLKLKKVKQAKNLLKDLASRKSKYSEKAKIKLKEIENI